MLSPFFYYLGLYIYAKLVMVMKKFVTIYGKAKKSRLISVSGKIYELSRISFPAVKGFFLCKELPDGTYEVRKWIKIG